MVRTIDATRNEVMARLDAMRERHRRAEMRCGLLERLEERLLTQPLDDDARVTARSLVAHFDAFMEAEAGDRMLYPLIVRTASRRRKPRTVTLVRSLESGQEELLEAWQAVRGQLVELSAGRRSHLDPSRVAAFAALTLACVAREEGELVPLTAALIDRMWPAVPTAPPRGTPSAHADRRSDSREGTPVGS